MLCLFTPKGLIIWRLYPATINNWTKAFRHGFLSYSLFSYLCCVSQHDADPVEHYGQIRRVKKRKKKNTSWTNMKGRGVRWGGGLDLETAPHTARASRYSAPHLKRLKTDDFSPRLPPVMCSARASKRRQFRESQREAQWIAVELAAAKAALKCRGIWAKWAAKGGNTWMWELAGWCCYLHIRVVICVWQRECYSQLC